MKLVTEGSESGTEDVPDSASAGHSTIFNRQMLITLLLVGLMIMFRVLRPVFLNQDLVLLPLVRDISIFTVVGLAQMMALSLGHMNLAVGRMAGFGAMFMGLSFDFLHLPLVVGALIGILAGAAVGAMSGFIMVRTGVSSFVVTLAMDFALLGLVPVVYNSLTEAAAFTEKPAGMTALRTGSLADVCVGGVCGPKFVPHMLWLALAASLLIWYMFRRTRLGREILLTGANVDAAELSGIPINRRIIAVHAISGALAALAGLMLAITTGSFKAAIGAEFMLPSFLGPILGGTTLTGGVVSVIGTILGGAVTLVIRKGLDVMGVGLEFLNIWLGGILLLAISTDRIRSFITERRGGQA